LSGSRPVTPFCGPESFRSAGFDLRRFFSLVSLFFKDGVTPTSANFFFFACPFVFLRFVSRRGTQSWHLLFLSPPSPSPHSEGMFLSSPSHLPRRPFVGSFFFCICPTFSNPRLFPTSAFSASFSLFAFYFFVSPFVPTQDSPFCFLALSLSLVVDLPVCVRAYFRKFLCFSACASNELFSPFAPPLWRDALPRLFCSSSHQL